jgi:V/A-type H+-transporting ATPase subunit A
MTETKTRKEAASTGKGKLFRIAGPVAVATDLDAKMYNVVLVGDDHLLGEVIQINGDKTIIQVYEDTSGLKPGEPVENTGRSLSVELGPGLLTNIYDGIQRPLPLLAERTGSFIGRGAHLPGLDQDKKWHFTAIVENGAHVHAGQIIGNVEEVPGFQHRIMIPPNVEGTISGIKSGSYSVQEQVATVTRSKDKIPIYLRQFWPVRSSRPVERKLAPQVPLTTGQRAIDTLFPIAKGGTAIIPGPFGAGKTVNQHQLAKWSDADIIIYVGCGERGNEMTDVLVEFPHLKDPRSGAPLMNRTVLIANTSNMPVAAREASIYTGVTIAEYFRDMGYDVAIMADSTSRWAEALREISSRLEEMPGEEGYPAYLASRLADFYERAAPVIPLSSKDKVSSLSIIGAVSPPGGDFFEPVTQGSLRVAKTFWALDAKLAQQRHFPSINWLESYSLYHGILEKWYRTNVADDWPQMVEYTSKLLQEEAELLEIVQLVGSDALPEQQQVTLHVSGLAREGLLQQSAFDDREAYCPIGKSYWIMRLMSSYREAGRHAIERGVKFAQIVDLKFRERIYQYKYAEKFKEEGEALEKEIKDKIAALQKKGEAQ